MRPAGSSAGSRRPAAALVLSACLTATPPALAADDDDVLAACLDEAPGPAGALACIGRISEPCAARPDAATTLGMAECLAREHQAWDALLNAFWPRLMQDARALDEANAPLPEGMEKAAPTLLAAQRAWLTFRDAECVHAYARSGMGSIRAIDAADCRRTMTAERAIDFHARLNPSR